MTPPTPDQPLQPGLSLILSIGKWGGFYAFNGTTKRLCLGWVALSLIPYDIDPILHWALKDPAAVANSAETK